jgi:trehalose/maltose hydrolase-like predicted phosphorylase
MISEVAPRRPIAADLLLGRQRVRGAQIIKQADVLMLHHLLPDEVAEGSLLPNLRYYEPRTAHGSSLSPAVHAALFARSGDLPSALAALDIASRVDLDDLTGTTAGGLHLATMGGLWQALVYGFAGVRPRDGRLVIAPHVPPRWTRLEVAVRFHGSRVTVRVEGDRLSVEADGPTPVEIAGDAFEIGPGAATFPLSGPGWEGAT